MTPSNCLPRFCEELTLNMCMSQSSVDNMPKLVCAKYNRHKPGARRFESKDRGAYSGNRRPTAVCRSGRSGPVAANASNSGVSS